MRFAYIVAAGLLFPSSETFAAFADADPTFHPASISGWACDREIASLPDDSAFVSLFSPSSASDRRAIAKMGPEGQRDASWGQDGVALLPSGFYPMQLVPRPQGGLLAVGDRIVGFSAGGLIDTSFGDAGVSDPVTTNSQVHSVSLQPDGSIVVLGLRSVIDAYRGRLDSIAFTRLTPQGRRDTSFGLGGYLTVTDPSNPGVFADSTILAWSIAVDGTAEITSYRRDANGLPTPELHRFPADFSASPGRLLPRHGVANWISPIANVDASGNLLFASWDGGTDTIAGITVMMFGNNARLVESFGSGGKTFVPVRGEYPTGTWTTAKALWRSADGGWLVLVESHQSSGGFVPIYFEDTARAVRLQANGTADSSFPQGQRVGGYQLTRFSRLKSGKLIHSDWTPATGCTLARQLTDEPRVEAVMVEYYHPGGDHYFMTLEGFESALLDANVATMGWLRTGQTFGAWSAFQLPGTKRLCRFYGDLRAGPNSHFYTPEGSECDGLRTQAAGIPIGQAAWRFEEYAASVVDAVDGKCPANLTPVYRVYNDANRRGITSNHRYMTDPTIYGQMIGKGWLAEGVRFCVPPEAPSVTTF